MSRAGVLLLLAATGCLSTPERRAVDAWLACEECLAGELDSVVTLGWRAVPALSSVLNGAADSVTRTAVEQFAQSYLRIRHFRSLGLGTMQGIDDSASFVLRYLAPHRAAIQKRAVLALWNIGTPSAYSALRYARARQRLRLDSQRADVTSLLDSLVLLPPP